MEKGHYEEIGGFVGLMTDRKNAALHNVLNRSGEMIRILYPHGIRTDQYGDFLILNRIIDNMCQIPSGGPALAQEAWLEIACFALMKCRDAVNGGKDEN